MTGAASCEVIAAERAASASPGFMGLEPGARDHAEGAALPRRNVVIAVGRGPITGIENVLDIELSAPGLVELQDKAPHRREQSPAV